MVVAVAIFSTLLLHIRRSSSQSAIPALLHGATMKPGGGVDDCTPNNSLPEYSRQLPLCVLDKYYLLHYRNLPTEAGRERLP